MPEHLFGIFKRNKDKEQKKKSREESLAQAQEAQIHKIQDEITALTALPERERDYDLITQKLQAIERILDTDEVREEELKERFRGFLTDTFEKWYSDPKIKARIPEAADHTPSLILPQDEEWQKKKEDIDTAKFGEYTINPETAGIDWETIPPEKIITKKLPDNLNGKPLADVAEYICKTYEADYYIPGLEYWKYILENPDNPPNQLKDGNWHFFFGSVLRGARGRWGVPRVGWGATDARWNRYAYWLTFGWDGRCRVVLFEK